MRKMLIVLVFILLIFIGCGVEPAQNSASIIVSPGESNTPEPTAAITVSVIVTPERTSIPVVEDYYLSSDSVILRCGLKISDLKSYFDYTKNELIQILGDEYEIVNIGFMETGYYYRKLGITLVFYNYNGEASLFWIKCDTDKLELNGLTADMDYNQIQERIGTEVLVKTGTGEENDKYKYDLIYRVGYYLLRFTSPAKDGKGFEVRID